MEHINNTILEMGAELVMLATKGAASSVVKRIKLIKQNKDLESVKNQYEEIINELLSEREEAIRIAMTYKNELERIEISDDDIIYLHNTISNVFDLMNYLADDSKKLSTSQIESIKSLISKDTLKSMQLLGFNYKKAIGEPLTKMCSSFLENKLSFNKKKK